MAYAKVQYVSEYSDLRMTTKKHMYNFNINVGEFLPSFLRFLLLFFALRNSRGIISSVTRLPTDNDSVTRETVCGKPTSSAGTTSSAASILVRFCSERTAWWCDGSLSFFRVWSWGLLYIFVCGKKGILYSCRQLYIVYQFSLPFGFQSLPFYDILVIS